MYTDETLRFQSIYSMQFKDPSTTFGKQQCCLSGKVGGMRDDLVICLQLAVYWTSSELAAKALI